jgi:hypothetical protein
MFSLPYLACVTLLSVGCATLISGYAYNIPARFRSSPHPPVSFKGGFPSQGEQINTKKNGKNEIKENELLFNYCHANNYFFPPLTIK